MFVKDSKQSNWKICDSECFVGPDLFLQVDLNGKHLSLFLDINLKKNGGWRTGRSLVFMPGGGKVKYFSGYNPDDANNLLYAFGAEKGSPYRRTHYLWQQDKIAHASLAKSLSIDNKAYSACWRKYTEKE